VAALAGVVLFALPFALRIVPVVIPLLRGVGLGMLGGAAAALFQVAQHISRRDFDASFVSKYALFPIMGAFFGAVLYLLSVLRIIAAPSALGIEAEPFLLMYLFALLAGLFNDAIWSALRGVVTRFKP
jgi:hypothetical protein